MTELTAALEETAALTAVYTTMSDALRSASALIARYNGSNTIVSVWLLPRAEWPRDGATMGLSLRLHSAVAFAAFVRREASVVDEQRRLLVSAFSAIMGIPAGCLLPAPMEDDTDGDV